MNAVTPNFQDLLYATVSPWKDKITKALKRGGFVMSYNDVLVRILKGEYLFFQYGAAFAVVEIRDFPNIRTAHMLCVGGCLDDVEYLQSEQSEAIATLRRLGVNKMTMLGRPGWDGPLPLWGWHSPQVYYEKGL